MIEFWTNLPKQWEGDRKMSSNLAEGWANASKVGRFDHCAVTHFKRE